MKPIDGKTHSLFAQVSSLAKASTKITTSGVPAFYSQHIFYGGNLRRLGRIASAFALISDNKGGSNEENGKNSIINIVSGDKGDT